MRTTHDDKVEDMTNTCFICGIDRTTFDRSDCRFQDHIDTDHNMWDYLFFYVHLNKKEATEFTGVESYVWECIERGDSSFFPMQHAMCLEGASDGDEEHEEAIDDLREHVGVVTKEVQSLRQDMANVLTAVNEMRGVDGHT